MFHQLMKLPIVIKLLILSYLCPEETQNIRMTSLEWNTMPKAAWSETNFCKTFAALTEDVSRDLRLAALADNLDMPSYIPHQKLVKLNQMYEQVPRSIRQGKRLISDAVLYYMQHGPSLMFHRAIKQL